MEVTATLARFLVDSSYDAIPGSVRHEGKRALLNILGCAIGSGRHATVERTVRALAPFFGSEQATLAGRDERCDISHAALINAMSAHVLDFDDTHPNAIHPSAPVWPALLALAEARNVHGRELLHAFILGAEVELRIGNALYPSHYEAGFHATGTCGTLGAAAACARLQRLDEQRACWALGLAASQASGLREMFGSDCKCLHAGKAAGNGLTAALLAAQYFPSTERSIEGPGGFADVLAQGPDYRAIGDGLGTRWELARNMYKPFACGLVVHAAIDGCIALRNDHALAVDAIEHVQARVNPLVMELTAKREPCTGLEGKFSVYHACAIALIRGQAGDAEFADTAVLDPDVIALRRRVEAIQDPGLAMMEAHVTIQLAGGRVVEKHVAHALGSGERPMSDSDLETKFRALVAEVLPAERAERLSAACWEVDKLEDAGAIGRLCGLR